ncbi:MAG: CcmD family protein [Chitinophagaceae bacterium]
MNKLNKSLLLLFALSITNFLQAQEETMANTMRTNGKIYVVVAVLTTILLGLLAYVIRLDKKISKLEKE